MFNYDEVVALQHAENDAFGSDVSTAIPKMGLTTRIMELLEKIKVGDATVDELNDYRQLINTTPNYPILSPAAFKGDVVVATDMSLESMSNTFDNVVEGIAKFIRRMWEFLSGLLSRFRGMLNHIYLSLSKKKKDIVGKRYPNEVPDASENYVVISEQKAKASFFDQASNAYTTDMLTTARTIKTLFEQGFMPVLRSEITAAKGISELSEIAMQAIATGNRQSARVSADKMDVIYQEQNTKIDAMLSPYVGKYVNGLEVSSGQKNLRFKVNVVTPPSQPFRIKALGSADLEQLLDIGMSITKELKDVADRDYKDLQSIYKTNSQTIEQFVNGRVAAKNSKDKLKQKDYEVMELVASKGVSHFQGITNNIAATMNTISRFAWTIEDVFYKENIRVLENLLTQKTGKVSLESDTGVVTDVLLTKATGVLEEAIGEDNNVRQELSTNNEHYTQLISRLRQHLGAVDPRVGIDIEDDASFSYQGSCVPAKVFEGVVALKGILTQIQQVLVTGNIEQHLNSCSECEFIGGGYNNTFLYKATTATTNDKYMVTDIDQILTQMQDTLGVVQSTLVSYVPHVKELINTAQATCERLQDPSVVGLVERSAIIRKLVQDRNRLLSGVNLLAVNAYLYDAIDDFTEAVFRELYN